MLRKVVRNCRTIWISSQPREQELPYRLRPRTASRYLRNIAGSMSCMIRRGKSGRLISPRPIARGYVVGWRDFLAAFQRGSFDLDEVEGDKVEKHIVPYQTIGGEPFYPGQLAGAAACRDALVALANNRKLVYLPALPKWIKRLRILGACEPRLNDAGRPTCIWWNYTTVGQKLNDEDLKVFNEHPFKRFGGIGTGSRVGVGCWYCRPPAYAKVEEAGHVQQESDRCLSPFVAPVSATGLLGSFRGSEP